LRCACLWFVDFAGLRERVGKVGGYCRWGACCGAERSEECVANTYGVRNLGIVLATVLVLSAAGFAVDEVNTDKTGLAIGGYDPVTYFAARGDCVASEHSKLPHYSEMAAIAGGRILAFERVGNVVGRVGVDAYGYRSVLLC